MRKVYLALMLSIGVLAYPVASNAQPIGPSGLAVSYRIIDPVPDAASVVESLSLTLGPEEDWRGRRGQWLHLKAAKMSGDTFEVWVLSESYPPEQLERARETVLRYVLKEGEAQPVEYQHEVTGLAVLPWSGAWAHLLPRPASSADTAGEAAPFPDAVTYLGHQYQRESTASADAAAPPDDLRVMQLRPDVLTGVPSNMRQVDETRRYDDSEYEYVPLTRDDYQAMIAAGLNCFRAEPEHAAWLQEAGVFYWGLGVAEVAYPECLYQPLYLGPDLFLNEPAVVTRDETLRPRLAEDPAFRASITVQDALSAFEEHYADVIERGAPVQYAKALEAREDVDLGSMQFQQRSLYSWETMISSAAYQLLYDPISPEAIVFEPPGQLGTRRTLPAMNMSYGCQIPVTGDDHFIDIIIGFLRGAARASDKEWGISIYGGVDRTDAAGFISRAYELGATRFFYWDNARLATVPLGEVLALTRHLGVHAANYPHRDLERLRDAAEVAVLLPPGYNLGHVHMGKGILWGVDELNLERRNREGVPYRTVMGNIFTEIERCMRLGFAFDLLWDLPELPLEGYREVVRVREDGKVEVLVDSETTLLNGPRVPVRPEGEAPRLSVALSEPTGAAPLTLTATAHVVEGAAPVYYAPAPDDHGIHHNLRVAWELYGPGEEDYTHRAPGIVLGPVAPHPEGGHTAEAMFHIEKPGKYRLRAATTDLAGRSTVVWKEFTVSG